MDDRKKLRRLARLGITGHQPSIAAHCKMSESEREVVIASLLQQKVGSNPKVMKQYSEYRKKEQEAKASSSHLQPDHVKPAFFLRYAKVSVAAAVKWAREKRIDTSEVQVSADEGQPEVKAYTSRILECTRCNAPQETEWMQLRVKEGYRAIHCKQCGKQERCARNRCQCGVVWHICPTHRIDPSFHKSRRGLIRDMGRETCL